MFPQSIPQERFDYFLNDVLLDGYTMQTWQTEWNNYIASGDDSGVRGQLEKLIILIVQSPEYQLF